MFRFLHLADLHLGTIPVHLGSLAEQRSLDFLDAFERAVGFAVQPENQINAVVIAGDMFDTPNPSEATVRFCIAQLKRLQHAKIPVVVVSGNHDAIGAPDCVYRNSSTGISGLIRLIDRPEVQLGLTITTNGELVNFYGMGWDVLRSHPPFDRFRKENTEGYHIALIHGTLNKGRYADNYSREVPLDLNCLAESEMDYIALGHIHSFQMHMAGSIPVVYSGTLEGRRFVSGEEGEKFLVVVTLEKGCQAKVETIQWNKRTIKRHSLNLNREVVENEDELVELIRNRHASTDNITKIEILGSPPFVVDKEAIRTRLSGDFFWLQIDDLTDAFDSTLVEEWMREDTIRGLFIQKLKEQLDQASTDSEKYQIELAVKLAIQAFQKSSLR